MPEFNDASYIAITNFIRAHHVWLILNADDLVSRPNATTTYDNDDFNAAFLFDPGRKVRGVYHKQKLVIFGEYIPLVRWLPFIKWFTPITGGFAAGNGPVQFKMEVGSWLRADRIKTVRDRRSIPVNTSPLICYEDMFPQPPAFRARRHGFSGEPDQ